MSKKLVATVNTIFKKLIILQPYILAQCLTPYNTSNYLQLRFGFC